ncbi:MAG: lipid biosynthesis B12-binding/radical SAM protein [Desulfobacterium sp.]|nr:lipid biosynthesis B12-binding/radical SAM protein [Desulfobacterium sp.]
MSRIFLISSNTCTCPNPVYPIGMAIVAASLKNHGHTVAQFDFLEKQQNLASLNTAIQEFDPDFIGISIRNIDNVDSTSDDGWFLKDVKALVSHVKTLSNSPTVLGGSAFSLLPQEILDYTGADHGIVGEGENSFPQFIAAMEQNIPQPRILVSASRLIPGDEMISPDFNDDLLQFYVEKSAMANLQTKRGCPNRCAYCSYPALEGTRFRFRDPIAVVDDIERLKKDHGIRSLFFTDSLFNDAQGNHLVIAEEIIRRDLDVRWSAFFSPKGISKEGLGVMKRSGLYAVELGTDAGCDETLEGINKGFSFSDVVKTNELCRKEEIPAAHFIMFGGPGERIETVEEGLRNIEGLNHCVVFAYSGIRILPGTDLHTRAIKENILSDTDSLLKPVYYFSPKIDAREINARILAGFGKRKDRIYPPSKGEIRMKALNMFGFKGLLWDFLLAPRN